MLEAGGKDSRLSLRQLSIAGNMKKLRNYVETGSPELDTLAEEAFGVWGPGVSEVKVPRGH